MCIRDSKEYKGVRGHLEPNYFNGTRLNDSYKLKNWFWVIFYSWSAAQKRVLLPPRQQVFWFNFNCWLDIYHKTPWSVESRHLLPTQLHLQQRRVKKLVKLSGRIFIVCWITNWKKNLLKILSVMVTSNLIESCTVIYKKKTH